MLNVTELKQKLNTVESQLKNLQEERFSIEHQIIEEERKAAKNNFNRWDVTSNNCLSLFTKDFTEHCLVRTMKIKEIDLVNQRFKAVVGCYFVDYEDYQYTCSTQFINFSSLSSLQDSYNIYVVDAVILSSLNQHLCELMITRSNLNTYKDQYKEGCLRVIQ